MIKLLNSILSSLTTFFFFSLGFLARVALINISSAGRISSILNLRYHFGCLLSGTFAWLIVSILLIGGLSSLALFLLCDRLFVDLFWDLPFFSLLNLTFLFYICYSFKIPFLLGWDCVLFFERLLIYFYPWHSLLCLFLSLISMFYLSWRS